MLKLHLLNSNQEITLVEQHESRRQVQLSHAPDSDSRSARSSYSWLIFHGSWALRVRWFIWGSSWLDSLPSCRSSYSGSWWHWIFVPLQKPIWPTPPRPHPTPPDRPETDPKWTRNGPETDSNGPETDQNRPKWTEIKLSGVGRRGIGGALNRRFWIIQNRAIQRSLFFPRICFTVIRLIFCFSLRIFWRLEALDSGNCAIHDSRCCATEFRVVPLDLSARAISAICDCDCSRRPQKLHDFWDKTKHKAYAVLRCKGAVENR